MDPRVVLAVKLGMVAPSLILTNRETLERRLVIRALWTRLMLYLGRLRVIYQLLEQLSHRCHAANCSVVWLCVVTRKHYTAHEVSLYYVPSEL